MFPILFILLCLVVVVVIMGSMARQRMWSDERLTELPSHRRAFDILDQRLAEGKIGRTEYDERHRTIAQGR